MQVERPIKARLVSKKAEWRVEGTIYSDKPPTQEAALELVLKKAKELKIKWSVNVSLYGIFYPLWQYDV